MAVQRAQIGTLFGTAARHRGSSSVPSSRGSVVQRLPWHAKAQGGVGLANVPDFAGVANPGVQAVLDIGGRTFTGHQYDLVAGQHADKTAAILDIAARIGALALPKKESFLKTKQFNTMGIGQTTDLADIANAGHKNIYKNGIDPFLIRVPATYGADGGAAIALNYQFGVASYGYIVKVEQEGHAFSMYGERGQDALGRAQTGHLQQGTTAHGSYDMFASGHDTGDREPEAVDREQVRNESIATVAGGSTVGADTAVAGPVPLGPFPLAADDAFVTSNLARLKEKSKRLDAVTKLGGEGARFACVRALAGRLSNGSRFHTADPQQPGQSRYIDFQKLWGMWDTDFDCKFNIPNDDVRAVVLAKGATIQSATLDADRDYDLG